MLSKRRKAQKKYMVCNFVTVTKSKKKIDKINLICGSGN